MDWMSKPAASVDTAAMTASRDRQAQLTKPPGSLGQLERVAERFAGWQARAMPTLERVDVCVFAGDHGVVAQDVSAFPQAVTGQMIANFATGGAAVSVLAREQGAGLGIVNVGTAEPIGDLPGVTNLQLAAGTADFTSEPAMSEATLDAALAAGRDRAEPQADLLIGGEMGIGNTTSAAALVAALTGLESAAVIGRGTGVDDQGLARKQRAVEVGLALHAPEFERLSGRDHALAALRCLGGLEIAALTGAYIAAAQAGVPVLVDGFITTAAALAACRIQPDCADWMLFAHRSAEAGHEHALEALSATPLLDLGMRLGEGSGAALAVGVLRSALAVHAGMATFADAGVADA